MKTKMLTSKNESVKNKKTSNKIGLDFHIFPENINLPELKQKRNRSKGKVNGISKTTTESKVRNKYNKEQKTINIEINYPEEWNTENESSNVINENLTLVTIDKDGDQYKKVSNKIYKCLKENVKITKIQRVENHYLWQKYFLAKRKLKQEKNETTEKNLFHGTNSNSAQLICQNGFDISFSNYGLYGRGVYFTECPSTAARYATSQKKVLYIIMTKVLTGFSFNAKKNMSWIKKPPKWGNQKHVYHDSIVDNNNIYVIYENEKAYPLYLIELKELN